MKFSFESWREVEWRKAFNISVELQKFSDPTLSAKITSWVPPSVIRGQYSICIPLLYLITIVPHHWSKVSPDVFPSIKYRVWIVKYLLSPVIRLSKWIMSFAKLVIHLMQLTRRFFFHRNSPNRHNFKSEFAHKIIFFLLNFP